MPPVQTFGWPLRHCGQAPQKPDRQATTWSPTRTRGDIVAHRLDDAGALVAQHERAIHREAAVAVDHVQVAVADAGGDGAHQHLAAPRLVDVDLLDGQRLVHLAEDGSGHFHGGRLMCGVSILTPCLD